MLALTPRTAEEAVVVKGLLKAFGLPRALFHAPNPVSISSAARRKDAISILTELAGAGMANQQVIAEAHTGLLRLMAFVGLRSIESTSVKADAETRFMFVRDQTHYVYAFDDGVYEPKAELGHYVQRGDLAALVHFPETPWREPVPIYFESDGEIVCQRAPALVRRGDCLFQLAEIESGSHQIG